MQKPASSGGLLLISGTCMKTTTQSGQAWRGYHCARRVLGLLAAPKGATQAAAVAWCRLAAYQHVQWGESGEVRTACGCGVLVGLWRKKTAQSGGHDNKFRWLLLSGGDVQRVRGETDHLLTQPVIQFCHSLL